METIHFLLKANIVFTILLTAYILLLRRLTYFQLNRAWHLVAPMAAFVLPLVRLPAGMPSSGIEDLLPASAASAATGGADTSMATGYADYLLTVYWVGVGISMLVLAVRIISAWRISGESGSEALSFFGRIVVPEGLDGNEARALTLHEREHVAQGHSLDVLYYEILIAINWWNPLWRLARRELRTIHELQADVVANRVHPDYGQLLLARALGVSTNTLVNSFRSSTLKTRIAMLNAPHPKHALLKYGISIPAVALSLFMIAPGTALVPLYAQEPVYDLDKVEVQPEYPGGMEAMYKFLQEHMDYPDQAVKDGVQGKVYIQFTLGQDGSVGDVGLKRGVRQDVDAEAMRAVRSMPAWKPGEIAGKPVATRFIIPVAFTLAKEEAPSGK